MALSKFSDSFLDQQDEDEDKSFDDSFMFESNFEQGTEDALGGTGELGKVTSRAGAVLTSGMTGAAEILANQEKPTAQTALDKVAGTYDNDEDIGFFNMPNMPLAALRTAGQAISNQVIDLVDYFTESDIREDIRTVNRDVASEAKAILGSRDMQYEGNEAQKLGYEVLEGVAVMGPAFIASWGTRNPNIMLSAIGTQVAGNTYNDWMDKTNGDHDRSMAAVEFNVLAEVLPETIPATAWLSKKAGPAIRRFVEGTLGEGVQEGVTQILQDTYDKVEMEGMSLKDALINIDWGSVGHATLIGIGVGGFMSTPATIGDVVQASKGKPPVDPNMTDPDPIKPDQSQVLFSPTHTLEGQELQQSSMRGQLVPNMYTNKAGDIIRSPEAVSITGKPVDLSLDVDAVAERMKAETAANNEIKMPRLEAVVNEDFDVMDDSYLDGLLEEEIEFDAVDDLSMDSQDASELFTDVMGDDVSYAEDRRLEADTAATSPTNDRTLPTKDQESAGNYKKAHPIVQGFNVTIENPVDSVRSGIDPNGVEWSSTMVDDYGYVKRTVGADSDPNAKPHEVEQVDIFVKRDADIGPDHPVYVIDQSKEGGEEFDEVKLMAGYDSEAEASERYLAHYAEGWDGIKNITEAAPDAVKAWLSDPSANDEFTEYVKGTPKRLKPVKQDAPLHLAKGEAPLPVETLVAAVRTHAAENKGDAGWDFVASLDDADMNDVIHPKRDKEAGSINRAERLAKFINQTAEARADLTTTTDENAPAPFNPDDMLARKEESPEVVAFFDEYMEKSYEHPLMPTSRIFMNRELNTGEDFALLDVRPTAQNRIHLSAIQSSATGKGNGQAGLDALTAMADKHGLEIELIPDAFGTTEGAMTTPQLEKWYARNGFKNGPSGLNLIRPPMEQAPFNPEDGMLASRRKGESVEDYAQRRKEYREANKERISAQRKEFYRANKERISADKKEFYVANREAALAQKKEYYEANKEEIRANQKEYYDSVGGRADYHKEYYKANREDILAQKREYNKSVPTEIIARNAKRRANKLKATPEWADTPEEQASIKAKYAEAKKLTDETGIQHHVDHIIPLQAGKAGGLHVAANLQVISAAENLGKNNNFDPNTFEAKYDLDGQTMLARKDPYAKMADVEHSYQVKVESTGEVHTVTVNARDAMVELDQRVEALEQLQACI